jgi:uncharacterized membrane protein
MLYVIGLGLSDERDITVKGLDAVKSCERVYLEAYTSILMVPKEKLVTFAFTLAPASLVPHHPLLTHSLSYTSKSHPLGRVLRQARHSRRP